MHKKDPVPKVKNAQKGPGPKSAKSAKVEIGELQMENDNRNAYSEVIEILKWVDDEKKLEALPMEMLEVLKAKSNPEYKPQISKEIPLDEQNLQPETFSILSWIATKYWDEEISEGEQATVEVTQENTQVAEEIKENIEQGNVQNIEESRQENIQNIEELKEEEISNMPILYKDLKWYEKIRVKIVEFFSRLFKRNHESKTPDFENYD